MREEKHDDQHKDSRYQRRKRCPRTGTFIDQRLRRSTADRKTVAEGMEWVRKRVAFYGSTRSYLPILSLHGLDELGLKLHAMSKR